MYVFVLQHFVVNKVVYKTTKEVQGLAFKTIG